MSERQSKGREDNLLSAFSNESKYNYIKYKHDIIDQSDCIKYMIVHMIVKTDKLHLGGQK